MTMAIVKANYVKRGSGEKETAKASIRYIQHRRGKDGAKITRTLFNWDGAMEKKDAYRMIDKAEQGSIFFRFVISPDPKIEDTHNDLYLRDIAEQTMNTLEERLQQGVQWVGAVHDDHTTIRHVHVMAVVPGRLQAQDFQAIRQAATETSLAQRRQLDLTREQKSREREEAEWERSV